MLDIITEFNIWRLYLTTKKILIVIIILDCLYYIVYIISILVMIFIRYDKMIIVANDSELFVINPFLFTSPNAIY